MSDVSLEDLRARVIYGTNFRDLIDVAAVIANAIHVGAAGMIRGSMMEEELRKALCLDPGELVNVPKEER